MPDPMLEEEPLKSEYHGLEGLELIRRLYNEKVRDPWKEMNPELRAEFEAKKQSTLTCPTVLKVKYAEEPKPGQLEAVAKSILSEAVNLVYNEREAKYGPIEESFEKIAQVASVLCNKTFAATDIVNMQIASKLVRESYAPKRDNRVDACGYLDILDRLKGKERD